jgi:hypothetical protein
MARSRGTRSTGQRRAEAIEPWLPPERQWAGLNWPGFLCAQAAGVLASGPPSGCALGTCLLAVWLLRAVRAGHLPSRARGLRGAGDGAARRPGQAGTDQLRAA